MIQVNTNKLRGELTENQQVIVKTAIAAIATALTDGELVLSSSETIKDMLIIKLPLAEAFSRELHQSIDFATKYEIQRRLAAEIVEARNVIFNIDIGDRYESDEQYEKKCLDTLNFTIPAPTV